MEVRIKQVLKSGEMLTGAVEQYNHFCCDNHITETAFEEVQKLSRVARAEKTVELTYSIFKNSASQKLCFAEIGREMDQLTVRPRGLFTIKFLTRRILLLQQPCKITFHY